MPKRRPQSRLSTTQRRLRYVGRRAGFGLLVAAAVATLVLADRWGAFGRARVGDPEKYNGETFRVVRVVDGDTLDVAVRDTVAGRSTTRIRLWGVDTPRNP